MNESLHECCCYLLLPLLLLLVLLPSSSNGMASVNGPSSPTMGSVFSYYWHGGAAELGAWGRLLAGSDQGLDDDITPTSRLNPFLHWESLADQVYLKVGWFVAWWVGS